MAQNEPSTTRSRGPAVAAWCLIAAMIWTMCAAGAPPSASASSGETPEHPEFMVRANRSHDWVEGSVAPGSHVVVDIRRDGLKIASSEQDTGQDGWFHLNFFDDDGQQVDLRTGDTVEVTAGADFVSLVMLEMDASVDAAADTISGWVQGVSFPATIRVEWWAPDGGGWDVPTDATGHFTLDLAAEGRDIYPGTVLAIWEVQPSGHMIGIVRSDLHVEADITDNDIWGQTQPNADVHLELHAPGATDELKIAVDVNADSEGNFGVRLEGDRAADIEAGDTVAASIEGLGTSLQVPNPFAASYDYEANTVCGVAPSGQVLTVSLYGFADVEEVASDDGTFCVDFSSIGNPGIDAQGAVSTWLSLDHRAEVRVRTPGPDLRVEKWGEDEPVSGRTYDWTLRYRNVGSMAAEGAALVDHLPLGLSFVSESTGTATVAGRQVIWDLGSVPPGDWVTITLRTRVAGEPGTEVQNCAEASTTAWEPDTGNNGACDSRTIVADEVDLEVRVGATPGDAVPGEEFRYEIGFCNYRSAAAQMVVVTQTVPSAFIVGSLWHPVGWEVDTAAAGLIRWTTASLRGGQCGNLFASMVLADDAPPNEAIRSQVGIASDSFDAEPGNNYQEHDLWVGSLRVNLWAQIAYGGGSPVAGEDYTFSIELGNAGNTVLEGIALTDTLPAGTTLVGAKLYTFNPATGDEDLETTLEPEAATDGWVRYRLARINPWGGTRVALTAHISDSVPIGTQLIDRVEVASELGDEDWSNNTAEYFFTTQGEGPNLWVRKWIEGDSCPGCGLDYLIRLANNGTEPAHDVALEDIFPDQLEFYGADGPDGLRWENGVAAWDLGTMAPRDDVTVRVHAGVPGNLPAGTEIVNLASATTSSTESRTDDNMWEVESTVGPNLQIEKRLCEGERLAPGRTATYCVEVRNTGDSSAPNVVIRDFIPDGMSYEWDNWGGQWEDGEVVWRAGNVGTGWESGFQVTFRVASDVQIGQSMSNVMEVSCDLEDADPADNSSEVTLPVGSPYLFRVHETRNWVGGQARPGEEIALTLRDSAMQTKAVSSATADGQGDFNAGFGDDILVGDIVVFDPAGGAPQDITVNAISIAVNPEENRVEGHVSGGSYPADMRAEVWVWQGPGAVYGQTDGTGQYSLEFTDFDVQDGNEVAVWYLRPDGNEIGASASAMRLEVTLRPQQWVQGMTAPDTEVTFDLLDGSGAVKATAATTTGPDGGFGTQFEDAGELVPMVTGDMVVARSAARSVTVTVPFLIPLADVPTDRVFGMTSLPSGEAIHVRLLHPSSGEEWWLDQTVEPGGMVLASFSSEGIDLGDEVSLLYGTPDDQQIWAHNIGMVAAVAPRIITDADAHNVVTIAGTGFLDAPQVLLAPHGQAPTLEANATYLTGSTLTMDVPLGLQGGLYDVIVNNPDGYVGYMSSAIDVREWRAFLPFQPY